MSFCAIIQARTNSQRFPGKVLMPLSKNFQNSKVLEVLINRISISKKIKKIIVVTSNKKIDNPIIDICKKKKIGYFRGSEKNVLHRVYKATKKIKQKYIIYLTGDNPLIDYKIIDYMSSLFLKSYKKIDFLTNNNLFDKKKHSFPDGMIVSIFKKKKINLVYKLADKKEHLEHPMLFFYTDGKKVLKTKNITVPSKWKCKFKTRLTLDTKKDLILLRKIFKKLSDNNKYFGLSEIYNFLRRNKHLLKINSNILQKMPKIIN